MHNTTVQLAHSTNTVGTLTHNTDLDPRLPSLAGCEGVTSHTHPEKEAETRCISMRHRPSQCVREMPPASV